MAIREDILAALKASGQYRNKDLPGGFGWRPMRCIGDSLGLGEVMVDLVTRRQPADILCIGSGIGFAPAVLGMAAKPYGGRIDFVDANYGSGVSGWWAFWCDENVRKWRAHYGLSNLTFHRSTTKQFFENVVNSGYDLVFVDGDHSVQGVAYDVERSVERLRQKGLILLHDARMARPNNRVGEYWQTIPEHLKSTFMPLPGLGIYAPKGGDIPVYEAADPTGGGYSIWPFPHAGESLEGFTDYSPTRRIS